MRILLVEDNELQRSSMKCGLVSTGYTVDDCADGEDGLWFALANEYDLIVLDIMLPKVSGLAILRRIRAAEKNVPVLLLTARDAVEDRVEGLDLGADDYLTKPFAFSEFLARVRARVRGRHQTRQPMLVVGDLSLDTVGHVVRRADHNILLTPREFAVLEYLMLRAGSIVTRTELTERLYEFAADPDSNALDVFISRIRRKLTVADLPAPIHTRRGYGYILAGERRLVE